MKVEDNKIIEATEMELFQHYLKAEYDLIMSFDDYLQAMQKQGVRILEDGQE